jgi:mRNA interferase MazF
MRPIHKVRLDKVRPAVILTREVATSFLNGITVAPITSTAYGVATEVPVGPTNGLQQVSVVSCDNITTVPAAHVLECIGFLRDAEEVFLRKAIEAAFDLSVRGR